jgi:hypothetical protein
MQKQGRILNCNHGSFSIRDIMLYGWCVCCMCLGLQQGTTFGDVIIIIIIFIPSSHSINAIGPPFGDV